MHSASWAMLVKQGLISCETVMGDGGNNDLKSGSSLAAPLMGILTKVILLNKIIFVSKWQEYLKGNFKKENDGTPKCSHGAQGVTWGGQHSSPELHPSEKSSENL